MKYKAIILSFFCTVAWAQDSFESDPLPVIINHPDFQKKVETPTTKPAVPTPDPSTTTPPSPQDQFSPAGESLPPVDVSGTTKNPYLIRNFYRALPLCLPNTSFDGKHGPNTIMGYEGDKCHIAFSTKHGHFDCYFPQDILELIANKLGGALNVSDEEEEKEASLYTVPAAQGNKGGETHVKWQDYCQPSPGSSQTAGAEGNPPPSTVQ